MRKIIWILGGLATFVAGAVGGVVVGQAQQVAPPSDHARLCWLEDRARRNNPWCDPVTSTTVSSTSSSTSTVPPTSSTSSTTSSSTTTLAPTTTSPPSGALFFEDFTDDDIADFTARFDWSVADLNYDGNRNNHPSFQGHHNMACEAPTTERTLHHAPLSNTDPGPEFWMCGPGGPATDHLMTTNGANTVFGVTAFAPKETFSRATAKRVCWDVNLTASFGRRLWWEVQILPANYVRDAISMLQMGTINGSSSERGTFYGAWGVGMDGTLMNRVVPLGGLVWDFTEEIVRIWRGTEPNPNKGWGGSVAQNLLDQGFAARYATQDRATRAHHCWVDNGNGTMTITQQRPGQADYVRTINGSFPDQYRVLFQAHNYNAGKDGTQRDQTWHWDNIEVSN